MYTHQYKGYLITGYSHTPECFVETKDGRFIGKFKNYGAAQDAIDELKAAGAK